LLNKSDIFVKQIFDYSHPHMFPLQKNVSVPIANNPLSSRVMYDNGEVVNERTIQITKQK